MAVILPFKKKQTDPFETLLMPHTESLYRLAYRLCGQQSDAEDLVQDLLIKLYPRLQELQKLEKLRPWLARSLYNLFIDSVRSKKRNPVQGGEEELQSALDLAHDPQHRPDMIIEQQQSQSRILIALEMLNEDQRNLINFHDVEGYTLPELETILDTPLGTLKSRLHRARAKLKDLLEMEPSSEKQRVRE